MPYGSYISNADINTLHLIMKNLASTIISIICLVSVVYSQTSNLIGIYEMKSHEPLIFASIMSIDSFNKEVNTDLDGKVHLNIFGNEELLIVPYIGFKSLIISVDELEKKDSIFLEQRPSDPEGLMPMSITEIYIPLDYSNCNAYIYNKAASNRKDLRLIREQKIELFTSELQEVCERIHCSYVANFQVDKNGNLRNFELVSYEYTPRIMDQVEKLRAIAEYILQNPTCFGPAIKKGHEEVDEGIKEYNVSLKSKQ